MTLLVAFLAVVGLVWLLMTHPSPTLKALKTALRIGLVIFAVVCLAIFLLWYFFNHRPNVRREERTKMVLVAVHYSATSCPADTPLAVKITNGGTFTVEKVEWGLGVFRPGFSTNLAGYSARYDSDRILAPGESFSLCVRLPALDRAGRDVDPAALSYTVTSEWIEWRD